MIRRQTERQLPIVISYKAEVSCIVQNNLRSVPAVNILYHRIVPEIPAIEITDDADHLFRPVINIIPSTLVCTITTVRNINHSMSGYYSRIGLTRR